MTKANQTLHILGSVARTLLGLTFIFSGAVKAIDPLGTLYKVEDYFGAFGGIFNHLYPLALPIALCLIAAEFVLGWMLLCNVWTKVTAWLALLFMLVMTPITLYLALTNAVADCGCFGDALKLTNWQTFWKNIILLVLVIILLCTKRFIPQTFVLPAEIGITCAAFGLVAGWMACTLLRLPVIDFRPYKIGNNITRLMVVPEDAPQDEYAITFIYEKDGQQQEFSLSDYPKDDSTWVFVDQKSTLIRKGYEAPIHDLVIYNEDFEDVTGDIIPMDSDEIADYDATPRTLAILYKLERTNLQQAKRLNDMAAEAEANGQPFYLITGSGDDEIARFRETAGYTYPIYTCDPVTLKTIVRANPGIVVVSQGTVIDKYNLRTR